MRFRIPTSTAAILANTVSHGSAPATRSATSSGPRGAAVIGVSNPELYASFRGETLDEFLATRKVPMKYSVAGGSKAKEMDGA